MHPGEGVGVHQIGPEPPGPARQTGPPQRPHGELSRVRTAQARDVPVEEDDFVVVEMVVCGGRERDARHLGLLKKLGFRSSRRLYPWCRFVKHLLDSGHSSEIEPLETAAL